MERLGEKENELAELRSQLNRRDRKPKSGVSKDQEQKQRLNRLTMDLEQDRMLMQKLEELNHQLEVNYNMDLSGKKNESNVNNRLKNKNTKP